MKLFGPQLNLMACKMKTKYFTDQQHTILKFARDFPGKFWRSSILAMIS